MLLRIHFKSQAKFKLKQNESKLWPKGICVQAEWKKKKREEK